MVFSQIGIRRFNENNTGELTQTELREILELLNEEHFSVREELGIEHSYQDPPDLEAFDHCHATARKYALANENLIQVPGYLILCIEIDAEQVELIELKAHSVVQNTKRKELLELMSSVYPLDKYYFIEHESGRKGVDLEVVI
jgi:hypothetical protein